MSARKNKQRAAAWWRKPLARWAGVFKEYPRHRLGRKGERAAARFLRGQGYKILRRNIRHHHDELDLMALHLDGRTIVFIEVRTRREGAHADLYRSVNRAKQKRLYRSARSIVKRYRLSDRHLRFDIITILWPQGGSPDIQHHPSAFLPDSRS